MAVANQPRILRVGIIQNGQVVEERLFRTREPVTVGQRLKNSFVIASGAFPQSFVLFDVKGGKYSLRLLDKMSGRVSIGDGVVEVGALRESGKAVRSGDAWMVEISDGARGKVALDDITILFQFVTPPPLKVAPQLPANMRGNLLTFIASVVGIDGIYISSFLTSFLLQAGTIIYAVNFVPPPARSEGASAVNERLIKILSAEIKPPEPPPEEENAEPDPNGEPADDAKATAPEKAPKPTEPAEKSGAAQEARSEDKIREEAQVAVRTQSALAALFNSDSGVGPALGVSESATDRTAEDVIQRQQAAGTGEGGIVGRSGLGGSEGASGSVRRGSVDVGGRSSVGAGATAERTEGANAAKVTVRVRGEGEKASGTGKLDDANLRSTIERRTRDIQRCYERQLATNPSLGGRLEIRFTIGEEGAVTEANVGENQLGSAVATCAVGAVRRWRFNKPEGGTVTVKKVWVLESGT
jgi:outer membrane biosynthesis protein TonB